MPGDDALNGGEPHTSSRKLNLRVQTLEGPEKAISIARIKADPVVSDEVSHFGVDFVEPKFDSSRFGSRGVLPCIAEKVLHHHAHQSFIGDHLHPGSDLCFNL